MMPATTENAAVLRIGKWRVDPALDEISSEGRTMRLEPLAMRLLLCLARHAGRPVELQQLFDEVWPGVIVAQGSVYQAIAQLRRTLGDDTEHPTYIDTVPRKGYRLIAPVTPWVTGITKGAEPEQPTTPAAPTLLIESRHVAPECAPLRLTESVPGVHVPGRTRRRTRLLLAAVVLVVAVMAALTWLARTSPAPAGLTTTVAPAGKSIAVLPFVDLSEKHDQEYFADGLADELLSLLATLPRLNVISRTSSFQFRGKSADLRTIGAQLGAAYVVEGSVRRYGDRVRVTAQLISTSDGVHRWSENYERNMGDVLKMQQDIAAALGRALQVEVGGVAWEATTTLRNPEAYTAYLRGLHSMDRYDKTGLEEAVSYFEQSLALDPSLIRARERLAQAHYVQYVFGFVTTAVGANRLREDIEKMLRENPRSAMTHALRAELLMTYDYDWAAAQREAALAVSLGKNNGFSLYAAADVAGAIGRWEKAETLFRQALVVDPLDADARWLLGWTLYRAGHFVEAEAEVRRVIEIRPSYLEAHFALGMILLARDAPKAALDEMQQELDERLQSPGLAMAFHALHRDADSNSAMQRAERDSAEYWPYEIACAHAYRGEVNATFQWLDRAYTQRDIFLEYIKGDRMLQSLETDLRYKALLRKMNLPE